MNEIQYIKEIDCGFQNTVEFYELWLMGVNVDGTAIEGEIELDTMNLSGIYEEILDPRKFRFELIGYTR